jgi:hypothetical protein
VAIALTLLAFTLSALASDRLGHTFIAAFLAAGAWLSAAALATEVEFRQNLQFHPTQTITSEPDSSSLIAKSRQARGGKTHWK